MKHKKGGLSFRFFFKIIDNTLFEKDSIPSPWIFNQCVTMHWNEDTVIAILLNLLFKGNDDRTSFYFICLAFLVVELGNFYY